MTKRVNRSHRTNWTRFIAGLFVGGVFLFQGTGYITSNTWAAERNENVTVPSTGVVTYDDSDVNYGLSGTAGGGVTIKNGVTAVVGELDDTEDSTSLDPTDGASLTIDDNANLTVGDATAGTLRVGGKNETDYVVSSLDLGDSATVNIGGGDANGAVTVFNGSSLNNNGGTITVGANGVLTFGEEDQAVDGTTIYTGTGSLANGGQIYVYNIGQNDITFSDYTDTASGVLNVTGGVVLTGAGLTLNAAGTVDDSAVGTVAERLKLVADITGIGTPTETNRTVTWTAASVVKVSDLVSVGGLNGETETGGNLSVLGSTTKGTKTIGGLQVVDDNGAGGDFTLGENAAMTISGLADGNKFTDGTNQVYDVDLDGSFSIQGTLGFSDTTSGIMFDGASAIGTSGTTPVLGEIAVADGDFYFYGKNATANTLTIGAGTAATSTVKETYSDINVFGNLTFDMVEGSTFTVTNNGRIWADSMTLDNANLTINNATLDRGAEAYTAVNALTFINGNISGKFAGITAEDGTASAFSLESGDDESDASMKLTGNVTFADTTFTINGGTLVNSEAAEGEDPNNFTATFDNTNVVNSGDNKLSVHTVIADKASLYLTDGHRLTFADGKSLTVKSGGVVKVDFGTGNGKTLIDLTDDDSTVTLAEGSGINVGDLSRLTASADPYKVTLVQATDTDKISDNSTFQTDSTAFYTLTKGLSDDGMALDLSLTVNNNFESLGATANEKAFGRYVDSFRTQDGGYSQELGDLLTDIMEMENVDDVRDVYNSLSSANKANSMMLAMSNPWTNAFDQMNWRTHRRVTPKGGINYSSYAPTYRGQDETVIYEDGYDGGYVEQGCIGGLLHSILCPDTDLTPNSAWASFHHTNFSADSDEGNSPDYRIYRNGVTVGYDMVNSSNTTAGIAFDYSQPYLRSENDRVTLSDFNLGFYGQREYYNGMRLSLYVGGGFQKYVGKRTVDALDEFYRSVYSGGSFAAAVQLARDIEVGAWSTLRPFVQFDTQQVWQDAYSEWNPAGRNVAALRYDKSDWNRSFVRAGFESEVNNQFLRFTGRVFYAGQLGNDSAPEMQAGFVGDYTNNMMTIQGLDLGRSFIDAGVGALGYLDCDYRWAISGNYDFAASTESRAHTGVVSLSYAF